MTTTIPIPTPSVRTSALALLVGALAAAVIWLSVLSWADVTTTEGPPAPIPASAAPPHPGSFVLSSEFPVDAIPDGWTDDGPIAVADPASQALGIILGTTVASLGDLGTE